MELIISEKAIAGQRIAQILAGKEPKTRIDSGAKIFEFSSGGKQYALIPLSGHIVELDFPKQYSYWAGTELKKLVDAPIDYNPSAKQIVALLRKTAPHAEKLVIATDADREGESIGVEALAFIKEKNPKIQAARAYFSAITPKDIQAAFSKPSKVDYNLADSADARREIDLIWGAVLTRFLSLISRSTGKDFLSAGRVQTPALALVVEREKERLAFKSEKYWELRALFEKDSKKFEALHKKGRFHSIDEAQKAAIKKADFGIVESVSSSERVIARPTPFNTTEFLRAATALGCTAGEAMNIAESLYMQGFCSYPRTDNTVYPPNLDLKEILNELLKCRELSALAEKILSFGKLSPSRGKTFSTDHPPIHPVQAAQKNKLPERHWKIYELIARRFLATLAEDCCTQNISAEILIETEPFIARGQLILEQGWKHFYPYSKISEIILPELKKGDKCKLLKLDLLEKLTQPPARYSEGALIKKMEDLGLGTKSTRHEIIQKLFARHYIFGKPALEPNKIAFAVIDSLHKFDGKLTKPKMTAELEAEMDLIAAGKKKKQEVVQGSRAFLLDVLEELLKNREEIASQLKGALMQDSLLFNCPNCSGQLRMLKGRTGKRFLGCTRYPQCTTSFPLPQKGRILALEETCPQCGNPMIKVIGRRPYKMCVKLDCPSKKDWGKSKPQQAAKAAKKSAKKGASHED